MNAWRSSRTMVVVLALGVTPASRGSLATAASAQQPVFAGEWTRAPDSAAGPTVAAAGDVAFRRGDMGTGWGSPLRIAQTADSLIVEYAFFSAYDLQPRLRLAYALDSSETRHEVMIGHAAAPSRSRAAWRAGTLLITTIHTAPAVTGGGPGSVTVRRALTLEAPDRLVIETTREAPAGGTTDTVRAVYLRGGT